jgi:hypothetical protein
MLLDRCNYKARWTTAAAHADSRTRAVVVDTADAPAGVVGVVFEPVEASKSPVLSTGGWLVALGSFVTMGWFVTSGLVMAGSCVTIGPCVVGPSVTTTAGASEDCMSTTVVKQRTARTTRDNRDIVVLFSIKLYNKFIKANTL